MKYAWLLQHRLHKFENMLTIYSVIQFDCDSFTFTIELKWLVTISIIFPLKVIQISNIANFVCYGKNSNG